MRINIIAAIGKNNEIGLDNQLLWKSKSDLEHFKQLTLGNPIIMGRKTFESLPGILPDRFHVVITRDSRSLNKEPATSDNLTYACNLSTALTCLRNFGHDEVFIIGGASIYEQALPLADELHISHMNWTGEADAFFPTIGPELVASKPIGGQKHPRMDDPLTWKYIRYTK